MDLAIAVVLGGAFGKVVDAVVSWVMGSLLKPALKAAHVDSLQHWPAGAVLVALTNFLVIAFVVFMIVRSIEGLRRRDEAVAPPDAQAQLASAATRLADALDRRQL
ncbi:MAG: large conductance mechanosensitive channel protein MscL [Synechococcaceae cyanobacterium]